MQRNGTEKGEVSMFGRALGLALAILVFSFGVALAEPEDEGTYGRDGFHVMLSGAYLLDEGASHVHPEIGDSGSVEGVLGFRWGPHFVTEFQVEGMIGGTKSDGERRLGIAFGPRLKYVILTGRLQPFVSTGFGLLCHTNEGSGHDWGGLWRAGTGLDFYLTEGLALDLTVEYLHGTGGWKGLRDVRFALGPQYRF
jgi:hypothetical protein